MCWGACSLWACPQNSERFCAAGKGAAGMGPSLSHAQWVRQSRWSRPPSRACTGAPTSLWEESGPVCVGMTLALPGLKDMRIVCTIQNVERTTEPDVAYVGGRYRDARVVFLAPGPGAAALCSRTDVPMRRSPVWGASDTCPLSLVYAWHRAALCRSRGIAFPRIPRPLPTAEKWPVADGPAQGYG